MCKFTWDKESRGVKMQSSRTQYFHACDLSQFFLASCVGVRLSQLGTSSTVWPIVPASDDRWWVSSSRWNENWQEKPKYLEKTRLSAMLSTTNPTWPDLGSNPDSRGGKPATNRLSYGVAYLRYVSFVFLCLPLGASMLLAGWSAISKWTV
jgi:hypothetical protein